MRTLHRPSGRLHLAILIAVVGQLPAAANADSLVTGISPVPIETVWSSPPLHAVESGGPADSGEPLPLNSFDVFAGELFAADNRAPGFKFSLNPSDEEVFLGWRFEF